MSMGIFGYVAIILTIFLVGCGGEGDEAVPAQPLQQIQGSRVASDDYRSMALDADGNIWTWDAVSEPLTKVSVTPSTKPTPILGISGVSAVSAAKGVNLALKADGSVWSWGLNEFYRYVDAGNSKTLPVLCSPGYPLTRNVPAPIRIEGLEQVVQISTGGDFGAALSSNGTVWTWGANGAGELGTGETADHVCAPTQVPGLTGITAIATGFGHVLALKSDGTVWSWGSNGRGQLGNGTQVSSNVPVRVPGLADIVAISAADHYDAAAGHSVAVDSLGTVWAWGDNSDGQVGNDATLENCSSNHHPLPCVKSPVKVAGLPPVAKIMTGAEVTFAIDKNGVLWGWGTSSWLGTTQSTANCAAASAGTSPCYRIPLALPHLAGFSSIVAGKVSTLALKGDGSLWSWANWIPQNTVFPPVPVPDPTGQGGFNVQARYGVP